MLFAVIVKLHIGMGMYVLLCYMLHFDDLGEGIIIQKTQASDLNEIIRIL